MLIEIISYIVLFWIVLSFVFPPFSVIPFILIVLFPQAIPNLKWLFVYTIITEVLLFFWNYELNNFSGEQLEDLADLSYALAQIFTFFLNLSVMIGLIVRFVQLSVQQYKRYRRIKFIRKYRKSRRS